MSKYFESSAKSLFDKLQQEMFGYQFAHNSLTIELIENHLKRVALDAVLDSEVEAEAAGTVPTRRWMPDKYISSPWDLTPEDF